MSRSFSRGWLVSYHTSSTLQGLVQRLDLDHTVRGDMTVEVDDLVLSDCCYACLTTRLPARAFAQCYTNEPQQLLSCQDSNLDLCKSGSDVPDQDTYRVILGKKAPYENTGARDVDPDVSDHIACGSAHLVASQYRASGCHSATIGMYTYLRGVRLVDRDTFPARLPTRRLRETSKSRRPLSQSQRAVRPEVLRFDQAARHCARASRGTESQGR